jgi:hypothetical protein
LQPEEKPAVAADEVDEAVDVLMLIPLVGVVALRVEACAWERVLVELN